MGVFDAIVINVGRVRTPLKEGFLRNFCVVSSGDSTIDENTIKMVTSSDWATYVTGSNETSKWLYSFFTQARGKTAYIFECGSSGTAADRLKALEKFIDERTEPCWKYSFPAVLYKDAYLQTLLAKYKSEDTPVYFSAIQDISSNTDPAQQTEYANWKGQKAFMSFYPSLGDDNFNIDGLVTGVMASSDYDLSSTVSMSNLERKEIASFSKSLGATVEEQINKAPCVFSKNYGNLNEVLNTKMADGFFWHTRYAQDYTLSLIRTNIDALFHTASNTVGAAIQYNDGGIQSVKQNLITSLKNARNLGLVNRFGASINISTGEITKQGDLDAVPFETYKNANPDDYKNGIYGGFSGYVEIQNFIVKIIFNVTLG